MTKLLREDKSKKPDFTLLPYDPMARTAQRFMEGAVKYARYNWRNCSIEKLQTYKESLLRHTLQYIDGQTDEDHLAGIVCNAMIIMDVEQGNYKQETK